LFDGVVILSPDGVDDPSCHGASLASLASLALN
jgi:hypothetical protein